MQVQPANSVTWISESAHRSASNTSSSLPEVPASIGLAPFLGGNEWSSANVTESNPRLQARRRETESQRSIKAAQDAGPDAPVELKANNGRRVTNAPQILPTFHEPDDIVGACCMLGIFPCFEAWTGGLICREGIRKRVWSRCSRPTRKTNAWIGRRKKSNPFPRHLPNQYVNPFARVRIGSMV